MRSMEICVKGLIDEHWSAWFEDLSVVHTAQGDTILTGAVRDQADLYGLIARLRDLGLPLVSVHSVAQEEG